MAPIDFYHKLKAYYSGHNVNHEPVLASRTSALFAVLFTSLYVLPFYLSRKTRPTPTLNRDAPSVIQARIQSVVITVTVALIFILYLLVDRAKLPALTSLHYLGLWPVDPLSILRCVVLTFILYLAPLYELIVVTRALHPLSTLRTRLQSTLSSSQGYRNYIAGPLTEELLFRSTIIPLHLLSHTSPAKIVWLTPLYFGIAHIHHFYEFHLTHPHTPLLPQLARSVFQFGYTTIFGWYAAFIYVRTGNLYAVFIIHSFCNWVGLPRFWGRVRFNDDEDDFSSFVVRGKEDSDAKLSRRRKGDETPMLYTINYYVLLLFGAFGFYMALFPLTDGADALASFGKSAKKV